MEKGESEAPGSGGGSLKIPGGDGGLAGEGAGGRGVGRLFAGNLWGGEVNKFFFQGRNSHQENVAIVKGGKNTPTPSLRQN